MFEKGLTFSGEKSDIMRFSSRYHTKRNLFFFLQDLGILI